MFRNAVGLFGLLELVIACSWMNVAESEWFRGGEVSALHAWPREYAILALNEYMKE